MSATVFLLRRLAISLPTLLGAFVLIFLIPRLTPGDPVALIMQENFTQSSYEAIQRQLGLDLPTHEQLVRSLSGVIRGDFGQSFYNRRPVLSNIGVQIPHTVRLAIAALIVAAVTGVTAGVIAAHFKNRAMDFVTMLLALLALSAPSFWLGIVGILVFSLGLGWLPSSGLGNPADIASTIRHLILPAAVLGLSSAGVLARLTRAAMLQVLSEDYIRTARAIGVSRVTILFRQALRNAMLPVMTVLGLQAVRLLTGTVVIEVVFARAGLGRTLIQAVSTRDYPQVQGVLLLMVSVAITMNILVDLLYSVVDPRIRYA